MNRGHSHRPASEGLETLRKRLRRRSLKVTGPRQAILNLLRRHPHPLTTKQAFEALPAGCCNLVTVYRVMAALERNGMVQRFDFGDGTARFELMTDGGDNHHHHLICTVCGRIVEIEDCFPPQLERAIATEYGFKDVTHRLEFFGLCPQCASGPVPP